MSLWPDSAGLDGCSHRQLSGGTAVAMPTSPSAARDPPSANPHRILSKGAHLCFMTNMSVSPPPCRGNIPPFLRVIPSRRGRRSPSSRKRIGWMAVIVSGRQERYVWRRAIVHIRSEVRLTDRKKLHLRAPDRVPSCPSTARRSRRKTGATPRSGPHLRRTKARCGGPLQFRNNCFTKPYLEEFGWVLHVSPASN